MRILNSLHCERLSSNDESYRLVDDFYNGRNPSIVNTLPNDVFEDDKNNRIAYYVVKSGKGDILFYFFKMWLVVYSFLCQ